MSSKQLLAVAELCDMAIIRSPKTDPNTLRESALQALQTHTNRDETRVRLLIALASGHSRLGAVAEAITSNREALRLASEIDDAHLIGYTGIALTALLAGDPAHAQEAAEILHTSLQALGSDPHTSGELRVRALEELRNDLSRLTGTDADTQ